MARLALTTRIALALVALGVVAAPAAEATWPGQNGRIYFICRDIGGAFAGVDVCAVNPDGSGLVNLTNTPAEAENTPAVSRDGRQVSFIRGSMDSARLWVMNADGSGARQVTEVPSDGAEWTPDGRHLAFRAKTGPSSYELQLVPASGGATTFLAPATGTHTPPRYTVDGRYVYTRSTPIPGSPGSFNEQIFVVADGAETQVTPAGSPTSSFPTWSPDGGRIVFTRLVGGAFALFAVSSGGGGAEIPLTDTATLDDMWGSFSPDGTKLVYHRDDNGFLQESLIVANADGSDPAPIPMPSLIQARYAVWAPVAGSGGGSTPPPGGGGGPAPTPKAPKPLTAKGPKQASVGKAVTVTLGCNASTSCVVTYRASVAIPNSVLASKTFKVKAKKVTVTRGKTKKVKVSLSRAARRAVKKALRKGRKPKLKVVADARQPDGGKIAKTTLSIALKR